MEIGTPSRRLGVAPLVPGHVLLGCEQSGVCGCVWGEGGGGGARGGGSAPVSAEMSARANDRRLRSQRRGRRV